MNRCFMFEKCFLWIINDNECVRPPQYQPQKINCCLFIVSVLKIRSKRYSQNLERGEREITADRRKREVFKKGPLEKQDMKRMRLIVGGTGCRCPQLDGESSHSTKERKRRPRRAAARGNRKKKERKEKKRKRRKPFYLIMGRKVGQKLLVTVMYKWQKKNQVLKKAQKDYFSKRTCPMFGVPGDTN